MPLTFFAVLVLQENSACPFPFAISRSATPSSPITYHIVRRESAAFCNPIASLRSFLDLNPKKFAQRSLNKSKLVNQLTSFSLTAYAAGPVCSDNAVAFLTGLPKCEHHMHIEGSLEPELLFNLAKKNQIVLASDMYSTIEALKTRYENFTSLDDFLAYFNAAMDVLLHEDDFAALAYAYMKRVSTDGLVHTEVFFDPQAHTGRGIELDVVVNGLTKGLKQGEAEFGISNKLIMCFVKHLSVESAVEAVGQMSPYFANGLVCGLGADSSEQNNPPSKFASVYEKAREVKVPHLTMHSGEEGPAEWVRETLALGINRVDHGVHAADDPELLKELAARNTLLTVCPLSNVRLRVHKDVRESPIPLLLEAGVPFSINSDDPSYFGGYILDNYLAVHNAFNFSKETWKKIALNSVNGSWCSEERKEEIRLLIDTHFQKWAGKDL